MNPTWLQRFDMLNCVMLFRQISRLQTITNSPKYESGEGDDFPRGTAEQVQLISPQGNPLLVVEARLDSYFCEFVMVFSCEILQQKHYKHQQNMNPAWLQRFVLNCVMFFRQISRLQTITNSQKYESGVASDFR